MHEKYLQNIQSQSESFFKNWEKKRKIRICRVFADKAFAGTVEKRYQDDT